MVKYDDIYGYFPVQVKLVVQIVSVGTIEETGGVF